MQLLEEGLFWSVVAGLGAFTLAAGAASTGELFPWALFFAAGAIAAFGHRTPVRAVVIAGVVGVALGGVALLL